jgi:hypothetical protein
MVTPAAMLHSPPFGGTNMMMEHRWTALVTLLVYCRVPTLSPTRPALSAMKDAENFDNFPP